jgi:hypothetical protein
MLTQKLMGATAAGGIQYVGRVSSGDLGTISDVVVSLTSLSFGIPPASEDIILVFVCYGGSNRTLEIEGFTKVFDLYSTDTFSTNFGVFYKVVGATPDESLTIVGGTYNADQALAYDVRIFRGVDTSNPLDVAPTSATGNNTILADPPSITPVTSGALIVAAGGGGGHTEEFAGTISTFRSSDLADFISVAGSDFRNATIGVGQVKWVSGAFNPSQFTLSRAQQNASSNSWASATIALRPA